MSLLEIITLGRKYLATWPKHDDLAQYFSEYRIIQLSRLVCRFLPIVALIIFILQLYFGSIEMLPHALVYALFILSMPIQTLVMLGVKADKYLPAQLSSWYKEGVAKINQSGGDIKLSMKKPRYIDLAQLLKITYQQRSH